jgi:glyoxylate utilization-related uncharacterized protein
MKKVTLADTKPHAGPGHHNMVAFNYSGKEETGCQKFRVGVSYYLPGGGINFSSENSPHEFFLLVLEGEMAVRNKTQEYTLGPMEGVYIGPYEGRELINKTNKPAKIWFTLGY